MLVEAGVGEKLSLTNPCAIFAFRWISLRAKWVTVLVEHLLLSASRKAILIGLQSERIRAFSLSLSIGQIQVFVQGHTQSWFLWLSLGTVYLVTHVLFNTTESKTTSYLISHGECQVILGLFYKFWNGFVLGSSENL